MKNKDFRHIGHHRRCKTRKTSGTSTHNSHSVRTSRQSSVDPAGQLEQAGQCVHRRGTRTSVCVAVSQINTDDPTQIPTCRNRPSGSACEYGSVGVHADAAVVHDGSGLKTVFVPCSEMG